MYQSGIELNIPNRSPSIPTDTNPYEPILSTPAYLFHGHYLPAKPLSISLETNTVEIPSPKSESRTSLVPPFQRRLPRIFLTTLGLVECFFGLIILSLQLLLFDLTFNLCCGGIDALAGAAILVLGSFVLRSS